MVRLAAVLISKDQAWNVGRLIESVQAATSTLPEVGGTRIVLVDSASTDGTIDVACRYPVRVVRLRPDQPLSPAAGRWVGSRHTDGELVLFLDGDMELCGGWLEHALDLLRSRPDAAGVTGRIVDVPKDGHAPPLAATDSRPVRAEPVTFAGGAALYRRRVLDEAGTFNPYLKSDEEPELCLRIRRAGYSIFRLDCPMVVHYSDDERSIVTLFRRWRRNLYLGAGQCIRYHVGDDLLWHYVKERGFGLAPALALLTGPLGAAALPATQRGRWWRVCAVLAMVVLAGDAYRKRSLYRTVHSLVLRALILDGTVRGFFAAPHDPATYPARLDVIRWDDPDRGSSGCRVSELAPVGAGQGTS